MKRIVMSRTTRRLILPLLAVGVLGGCAVVPYDDGYYARPAYNASVYVAPAPVYVGPSVYYRSGPRYYHPRYYRPGPGWRR
ncbi:hypothetical protein [uncultured Oxalicibacterium sp.]|uniref:hypothetical protein n=1 Tax=uncultured Oxalicibacterium sp. TaxID=1168540 RepID=UPI0025FECCF6|nr:hypothetical protein [uncultured Oxalicibacterium sp.]